MEREEIIIAYHMYADQKELSVEDQDLLQHAISASASAYVPYSEYKVGIAIRTIDKSIVTGSNQENGSFPIGQCAERVALYRLSHEHGRIPIDTIAIMVDSEKQIEPASPCGSCRQILNEYRRFQSQPIRLLLGSTYGNKTYEIADVKDLLPLAFEGFFLGH